MAASRPRLASIDLLRGAVMALMALDHVRDFWFSGANPTDLDHTTAALFFTRFVTHYCAPVFVFTAGLGAALSKKPARELGRFLALRGLLLVLLELTWNHWMWRFKLAPTPVVAQVLWALGWSMVALAGLVQLPRWVSLVFGLVVCLGHNALDGWHGGGLLWGVLHEHPRLPLGPEGWAIWIGYPLVPWVGVMALGWAAGPLYALEAARRRRALLGLGAALVAGFVVGRWAAVYGDPHAFTVQTTAMRSLLAFLNVHKYPPSLLYLCVTLGPALLFLGAFDHACGTTPPGRVLVTFGRTPLFFYLLHVALIHGTAVGAHALGWLPDGGVPLWALYLVWPAALAVLYPACRWYDGLKARRPDLALLRYV